MKTILLLTVVCLFLSIEPVRAEIPNHIWSASYGDPSGDLAWGLAVGPQNEILVCGYFYGDLDLGDGLLVGQGGIDGYLARYSGSGDPDWSLGFGSPDDESVVGVCTDDDGNVLVVGHLGTSLDLGGGPLTGPGTANIFLAKFTSAGALLWGQAFGTDAFHVFDNIQTDGAGNVYLTGVYEGSVSFGGAPIVSVDGMDMFVAKFDPGGAHLWSRSFGGAGFENWYYNAMRVTASGDIYLADYGAGNLDLGGGTLVNAGLFDVFVARLDGNGDHVWSRVFGGTDHDVCMRLALAPTGGCYLSGLTYGTVDFGGGVLGGAGQTTSYVVRLGAGGEHGWSTGFAAGWGEEPSLAVDADECVYLAGFESGDIDLGGGVLPGIHGEDPFLACFDASGGHLWSRRYGGTSHQYFRHIATDSNRRVIVFGDFHDSIDLGGGPLEASGSSLDLFLAKLGPPISQVPDVGGSPRFNISAAPNPFNPKTRISFTAQHRTVLTVRVFDTAGRHIRTLAERIYAPGPHTEDWDGRDTKGRAVATGTYVVRVEGIGVSAAYKLALIR